MVNHIFSSTQHAFTKLEDGRKRHRRALSSGLGKDQQLLSNEALQKDHSIVFISNLCSRLNSGTDRNLFSAGCGLEQRCTTSTVGQKPQFLCFQGDECKDSEPTHFDWKHQHCNSCSLLQRWVMSINRCPSTPSVEFPTLGTTTGEKANNMLLLTNQAIGMPIRITASTRMPKRIVF